jgi:hypothetical protein
LGADLQRPSAPFVGLLRVERAQLVVHLRRPRIGALGIALRCQHRDKTVVLLWLSCPPSLLQGSANGFVGCRLAVAGVAEGVVALGVLAERSGAVDQLLGFGEAASYVSTAAPGVSLANLNARSYADRLPVAPVQKVPASGRARHKFSFATS